MTLERGVARRETFSDFQSESPCKGAHGFTSQWSWQNDFCCFLRV